jgi:hypothetical protein
VSHPGQHEAQFFKSAYRVFRALFELPRPPTPAEKALTSPQSRQNLRVAALYRAKYHAFDRMQKNQPVAADGAVVLGFLGAGFFAWGGGGVSALASIE